MTYLRVSHLTVRQTYIESACADESMGTLSEVFIKIGLLCSSDSVAVTVGVIAEAVHNNKCYGFL